MLASRRTDFIGWSVRESSIDWSAWERGEGGRMGGTPRNVGIQMRRQLSRLAGWLSIKHGELRTARALLPPAPSRASWITRRLRAWAQSHRTACPRNARTKSISHGVMWANEAKGEREEANERREVLR